MAKASKARRVKFRNDLTAEYVRSIFLYDPLTGKFYWRHRPSLTKQLNARDAGQEAGYPTGKNKWGIEIDGIPYLAHRLAWLYVTGTWPIDILDHEDRNGRNNKWSNLREANHSQNAQNRKRDVRNKSGYKGVYWHKKHQKWCVSITENYKQKHVGLFTNLLDARDAYRREAIRIFGPFASF